MSKSIGSFGNLRTSNPNSWLLRLPPRSLLVPGGAFKLPPLERGHDTEKAPDLVDLEKKHQNSIYVPHYPPLSVVSAHYCTCFIYASPAKVLPSIKARGNKGKMSKSAKQFQADKTQQTRSSGKTTEFLNDKGCQARCWGTRPQRTKKGQQTQQLKETLASKPTSEEPTLKGNVPVRNLLWQTMNKSNKSQQTHWPGPSNHIKPTNFGQPPRYETSSTECNLCAGLQALLREHLCWQHSEILTICSCSRHPNGTSAQPSIHATTRCLPHPKPPLTSITSCLRVVWLEEHDIATVAPVRGPSMCCSYASGTTKFPQSLEGWLARGISPPKSWTPFC